VPRQHFQQLRDEDRRDAQTEERQRHLLNADIAAVTRRLRCIECRDDARRRIGAFGKAHHGANQDQRADARCKTAQARQQRKHDDRRNDDLAVADAIGEVAHEHRRDAPRDGERAGNVPEVLIVEMQIRHHDGKERHDHEPVDTDQSEAERQQGHGFPLVGDIPP
jgi:hypothetical protein